MAKKQTQEESRLDALHKIVSNGEPTETDRAEYTDLLIEEIGPTLSRWKASIVKKLDKYGYEEWTGQTADDAVAEAVANVRAGKVWQGEFFKEIEDEVVRLTEELPRLKEAVQEAAKKLPGIGVRRNPDIPEQHKYKEAVRTARTLYTWWSYLIDIPKTLTFVLNGQERTNPRIRKIVRESLQSYIFILSPTELQRFLEAIGPWERGELTVTAPPDAKPKQLKRTSLFKIDDDGLSIGYGNPGTHGLVQARYSTKEIKTESGKKQIAQGIASKTQITKTIIPGDSPIFDGLGIVAKKLVELSGPMLYELNRDRKITVDTAQGILHIDLQEWMDLTGTKTVKRARESLQSAANELEELDSFSTEHRIWEQTDERDKKGNLKWKRVQKLTSFKSICDGGEFEDAQTFVIAFSPFFVTYLANTHLVEKTPVRSMLALSSNDSLALEIVDCVFQQWNTNNSKAAFNGYDPNHVVVSVMSLLQKCPSLPLEKDLTAGQKKNLSRTYIKRINEGFQRLVDEGTFTGWELMHKRGIELSDDDKKKLNKWSFYKTLYLHVDINAPHQKQYLLDRAIKDREAAAKRKAKKEAEEQAKSKKSK